MNDLETIDLMIKEKVCSIIRGVEEASIDELAKSLIQGGISVIEVTFNTTGAAEMIQYLSKNYPEDFTIGAGTVLDTETAGKAIDAGAQFILSPILNVDVIKFCLKYNAVPVPGILTPTEALTAWENGARIVKVFPAGVLGANYIKQMKGPLPQLRTMAVGAINHENVQGMFQAGADCVGVGSEIVNKELVKNKNFKEITERAKKFSALSKEQ